MYENNLNKAELQVNRGFETFIKKKEDLKEKNQRLSILYLVKLFLFSNERYTFTLK